jgi:hypothetical protein
MAKSTGRGKTSSLKPRSKPAGRPSTIPPTAPPGAFTSTDQSRRHEQYRGAYSRTDSSKAIIWTAIRQNETG